MRANCFQPGELRFWEASVCFPLNRRLFLHGTFAPRIAFGNRLQEGKVLCQTHKQPRQKQRSKEQDRISQGKPFSRQFCPRIWSGSLSRPFHLRCALPSLEVYQRREVFTPSGSRCLTA